MEPHYCVWKSRVSDFMYSSSSPSPHLKFTTRATLAKSPETSSRSPVVIRRTTESSPKSNSSLNARVLKNTKSSAIPQPLWNEAAAALCNTVESIISDFIDPGKYPPSQDPKVQLAGNFAPVSESPPQLCEFEGTIPACLRGGAYIRNGSNPLYTPVAGYHYFDGHGMLHSVKFSELEDGSPVYCARFTKTNRFLQEQAAGRPLFPNMIGDMSGYPGLARLGLFALRIGLGLVDIFNGMGTSNAGMNYFHGRILAMSEEDLPHVVKLTEDGDLETVGRYSFNNELFFSMCAHPKIDPCTGQLFAFAFNPVFGPQSLRYFWSTPDGKKSKDFTVNLGEPSMFHDFAVTQQYAIFPEGKAVLRMENLLLKNKSVVVGEPDKVTRFGVIPRIPSINTRVKWFDVPDWTSFHYLNAWEEGDDKIVVLSACISPVDSRLFDEPERLVSRLYEIHLDLRTGQSSRQHVCSAGLDFGQINQKYLGRRNRYVYMCMYGPWPKFAGLVKVDLEAPRLPRVVIESPEGPGLDEPCIVAKRRFEPGTFCNEPYFVGREEGGGEDDGYVLCHVHNEETGVSELLVMDAKSPTLTSVAVIKLPARVPYGFHGVFVNAHQVINQAV